MTPIKPGENQYPRTECDEKKVRFTVCKNGVENVYRKETSKNPEYFIESHEESIFKGRPRSRKNAVGISLEVKGKIPGMITQEIF